MCPSESPQRPRDWRMGLRNVISNWDQPLPLGAKLLLAASNYLTRAQKRSGCCGHPGEPGC